MRWYANMLPGEKHIYFGILVIALLTIASFIETARM
jgi:hypothetical protein